jgi:hypothetical protein
LANSCCGGEKQDNKMSAHRLHDHPPLAGTSNAGIHGHTMARPESNLCDLLHIRSKFFGVLFDAESGTGQKAKVSE